MVLDKNQRILFIDSILIFRPVRILNERLASLNTTFFIKGVP
jgi:hypothetical protein